MNNKKLLIIGSYNPSYPRNRVLISVLQECFAVTEVLLQEQGIRRYLRFVRAMWQWRNKADCVLVMQPAHTFSLPLFCLRPLLTAKVIVDAFYSIYDSYVWDRKLADRLSLKAAYYFSLDFLLCHAADVLLFDTEEHRMYFKKTFHISSKLQTVILPVALDLAYHDTIEPKRQFPGIAPGSPVVLFYGYYIPLQGVDTIMRAARMVEDVRPDIRFVFIGSGQTRKAADALYKELKLANGIFIDRIPYEDLIGYIKLADVCLGIFGETAKAQHVVPNKVLDYAACAKPIITSRTPAVERYVTDGHEMILVPTADPGQLAAEIILLMDSQQRREALGLSARKMVEEYFSTEVLHAILQEAFV